MEQNSHQHAVPMHSVPSYSPRVILKIPDITAGLNNTTVSVSDSDPCSPVGVMYKDISKTLTPRAKVFERPVKTVRPSETIMRKVDLTCAGQSEQGSVAVLRKESSPDKNESPVEDKCENSGQNDAYLNRIPETNLVLSNSPRDRYSSTKESQGDSPVPKSDCTDPEQRKESSDEQSGEANGRKKFINENILRNSPLTFYSTPSYGAVPFHGHAECTPAEAMHVQNYSEPNVSGWPANINQSTEQTSAALETPPLPHNFEGNIFNFANPAKVDNGSPYLASSGYRSGDLLSPVANGNHVIQPFSPQPHLDVQGQTKVVYVPVPVPVDSKQFNNYNLKQGSQVALPSMLQSGFKRDNNTVTYNHYSGKPLSSSSPRFGAKPSECVSSRKLKRQDFSDISSSEDEYDGLRHPFQQPDSAQFKGDHFSTRQNPCFPKKRKKRDLRKRPKRSMKNVPQDVTVQNIPQNAVIQSTLFGQPTVPCVQSMNFSEATSPQMQHYSTLSGMTSFSQTCNGYQNSTRPETFSNTSPENISSLKRMESPGGRKTPNTIHHLPSAITSPGEIQNFAGLQNQNQILTNYTQRPGSAAAMSVAAFSNVSNMSQTGKNSSGSVSPGDSALSPTVAFAANSYVNSNQMLTFQQVNNTFSITPTVVPNPVQGIRVQLTPCGNGQFVLSTNSGNITSVSPLQTNVLPMYIQNQQQPVALQNRPTSQVAPQTILMQNTSPLLQGPEQRIQSLGNTNPLAFPGITQEAVFKSATNLNAVTYPQSDALSTINPERTSDIYKNLNQANSRVTTLEQSVSDPSTLTDTGDNVSYYQPPISGSSEVKANNTARVKQMCDIKVLKIGTFRYSLNLENEDRNKCARVKVCVAKQLLIYELELIRCPEDPDLMKCPFTIIELPFDSICGLGFIDNTNVLIEVNKAGAMYLGYRICDTDGAVIQSKQGVYNRNRITDLTSGQLSKVAFHEITLRKPEALKFLIELAKGYPRFMSLLQQPVAFDRQKKIERPDHEICGSSKPMSCLAKHFEDIVEEDCQVPGRLKGNHTCMCAHGCQFSRCGCIHRTVKCGTECKCNKTLKNCLNPVNKLEELGFNLTQCYKDLCFMTKMFNTKDVGEVLASSRLLPCCGTKVTLSQISPGLVRCPGCFRRSYKYSWCLGILCDEGGSRRRHCAKCGRCADESVYHCKKGDRCHPVDFLNCVCCAPPKTKAGKLSGEREVTATTASQPSGILVAPHKDENETVSQVAREKQNTAIISQPNRIEEGDEDCRYIDRNGIADVTGKCGNTNEKQYFASISAMKDAGGSGQIEHQPKLCEDKNNNCFAKPQKVIDYLIFNNQIPKLTDVVSPLGNLEVAGTTRPLNTAKCKHQRCTKREAAIVSELQMRKFRCQSASSAKAKKSLVQNIKMDNSVLIKNHDPMCGGEIDELSDSGKNSSVELYEITGGPDSESVCENGVAQHIDLLPDLPNFPEVAQLDLGKPLHESSPMSRKNTK